MNQKIISVIGGKGFIGNYLVDQLLAKGYYVKIISRNPKSKKAFYPSSKLGQYALISCNICNEKKLQKVIEGSFCVINLVGVLENKGKNNFNVAHVEGSQKLVAACNKNKIKKLIHISAIGVDKKTSSNYAITKLQAEKNIKKLKGSIIIRPSVVCGDEDNFLNFFARYTKFSPFLPLIGGGNTKFQPILVSDLASIIIASIDKYFKNTQILEVGGPDILSFKEILFFLLKELNIKRVFLKLSFPISRKLAFILEKLPVSLLTRDQVEMLKIDNIVDKKKSYQKFIKYETTSFFIFAKKQLKVYKKNGGH
jgi:NADH dehydrogenase